MLGVIFYSRYQIAFNKTEIYIDMSVLITALLHGVCSRWLCRARGTWRGVVELVHYYYHIYYVRHLHNTGRKYLVFHVSCAW